MFISKEVRRINTETLATFRPDFMVVAHFQLQSIVSHSVKLDAEYFASAGIEAKDTAPSRQRKHFGFLFDSLTEKCLNKPMIRVFLTDRPEFTCVPICLYDDFAPYGAFEMKVLIPKLNEHCDIKKKG